MASPQRGLLAMLAMAALAVLAFLAPCANAAGGTVIDVDAQSLVKIIAKHKRPLLVEWFTPTCGHCVRLVPVLDEVAAHYTGKLTVVKIDSRSAAGLNSRFGVRATPTLLLFRNGTEIKSARKDLQGYRSFETLTTFLDNFVVPNPLPVSSITELDPIVEQTGFVVVGLFESDSDPQIEVFNKVAGEYQGHGRFATVTSAAMSNAIAERYEITDIPSVFVLKALNHTVTFEGAIKENTLDSFVNFNAFPLVGNFSVNTFYRYKRRPAKQVLLFHDHNNADAQELEDYSKAMSVLENTSTDHDDVTFMSVGHKASEEDGRLLLGKMGLTPVTLPVVGIRSPGFTTAVALNALAPITERSVEDGLAFFSRNGALESEYKCLVSKQKDRGNHYTPELVEKYDSLAQREKARLGLSDDLIREVDMATFSRQLQKSWKDVVIIYTARWCSFSTRLEEIFHRMLRAGEFEELLDEVQFVKIDVVLTQADDYRHLQTVPAMKYISARYKDFPNWYNGPHDDPDQLVQFVHSYHSMRHVEIPGEGPSPYSRKQKEVQFDATESLNDLGDEIVF